MTRDAVPAANRQPAPVRVSVGIVYYDTDSDVFDRVLADLGQAIRGFAGAVTVAVVDNSDRLDPERVRATLTGTAGAALVATHVLAGHGNVGFGRGHNLALAHLPLGDYHLILNPDVYLAPDYLVRAVACLDQRPEAIALTPHAETIGGTRQYLCKRYPDPLTLLLRASPAWLQKRFQGRLARYERRDRAGAALGVIDDVELASGCCLLCRTAALHRTGGFDPGYFLYFEDFDLSLRLRPHGRIVHDPDSRIVHLSGGVARKSWRHWGLFLVSALRFFRTHGRRGEAGQAGGTPEHHHRSPELDQT